MKFLKFIYKKIFMFKKIMFVGLLFSVLSNITFASNELIPLAVTVGVFCLPVGVAKACIDGKFSSHSLLLKGVGVVMLAGMSCVANNATSSIVRNHLSPFSVAVVVGSAISLLFSSIVLSAQVSASIKLDGDAAKEQRERSKFSATVAGVSVLSMIAGIATMKKNS